MTLNFTAMACLVIMPTIAGFVCYGRIVPMIKAMSMVHCIGLLVVFLNICLIINILVEFQKFRNINCIDLVAKMYLVPFCFI